MLRQKDIIKYKTKSKIDQILYLRKDAEYLLKNSRPIKENLVPSLNDIKVHEFIEDILTSNKISKLLFAKNSKFEVKTYLNIKKRFFTHKNIKKVAKKADNITTKILKKDTNNKLRNEINTYKKEKQKLRNSMDKINEIRARKFKKDLNMMENEPIKDLKRYKINGFTRAYSTIKYKFDTIRSKNDKINRNNSCVFTKNYNRFNRRNKTTKNKNNKSIKKSIKSLSSETTETERKVKLFSNSVIFNSCKQYKNNTIHLPNVKLNINDVFNRLYHNVVLLSPSKTLEPKKRPLSRKNTLSDSSTVLNKNKIEFNLKKVIKSTSGKEFTLKITNDIIQKCFVKYSGGPETLKMFNNKNHNDENENIINDNVDINEELEEEIGIDKKCEDYLNFYKLIDKKTGNSFLHLAVIGGYDEFVRYFLEKKADINMKNYEGNTPLHLALFNNDKKIIDILMNNKPKLDIPNNKGEIQFDLFTNKMKEYYGIDKLLIVQKNKK